jgi:hypothetical protein
MSWSYFEDDFYKEDSSSSSDERTENISPFTYKLRFVESYCKNLYPLLESTEAGFAKLNLFSSLLI